MMDTTSSIKNDRIKKENKLQITKVTPPKKRNAIWKCSKDEKKECNGGRLALKDVSKPLTTIAWPNPKNLVF